MTFDRSAVLRGGLVIVISAVGLVSSSAAFLWWGTTSGAVLVVIGIMASLAVLVRLYERRRPLRFASVALVLGVVALFVLNIVGLAAARDAVMTLAGDDAEAVVTRTWTEPGRGGETYHCTVRRADGGPVRRELASGCAGYEPGDTLQIVIDPGGRFAPVAGPESDLPVVGQAQVAGAAALVLLLSVAIGSGPRRPARHGRRGG
ncbi:hypothetical protein [Actinomadura sediminis]|uniref:DUF3592 domain-containing protein n=1 Tax=Actinomadura sediminis TaxID=1038904 RepID=A0ABW3EMA5_9ACTN